MSHEVESTQETKSYKYWLTLDQWRQDPEFQKIAEAEFQSSPLREGEGEGGWARREFLKLMGASLALTTFGCVRRPAQKIVPYAKAPRDLVQGIPNFYASSFVDNGEAFGTLVTTREGRPIKIDGNKLHPANEGGMSARAHAHILSLYDPDRLSNPVRNLLNKTRTNRDTVKIGYEQADKEIAEELKKGDWAILTGSLAGPSQRSLVREFSSAFGAKHYVWDALSAEHLKNARQEVFGDNTVPRYLVQKAKMILAVESDFLGTYLAPTEAQKAFGKNRKPGADMNRLVVAESLLSLTGTNADDRFIIKPTQAADFICAVLYQLLVRKKRSGYANDSRAILALQDYAKVHEELGVSQESLAEIAEELWNNRGRSIVFAGEDFKAQVAAQLLNAVLDNEGSTIDSTRAPFVSHQGSTADLKELVAAINNGSVKRLLVHGVNPLYSSALAIGAREAFAKLELCVYTGTHNDETGLMADYVLPDHHPLENWGDAETYKGVVSIQQPTIRPLGSTRAFEDSLIALAKAAGRSSLQQADSWYDYLRSQWRSRLSGDFEGAWVQLLSEGISSSANLDGAGSAGGARTAAFTHLARKDRPSADLELVLYPTVGLRDGSLANVSWLQEFPDPVTKICWDNYVTVSVKTAETRKLHEGQIVELNVGDRKVSVPVHIQPGQHDQALGLALGYGRTSCGQVGNNVGVNAFELAAVGNSGVQWRGLSATLKPTHTVNRLACTAGHHSMESRQIVVEASLKQFAENPGANIHRHEIFSAWAGHKYESYKWGMTIDLNSCTGCSACVIACQSENNVPTVGKKYVLDGREMHWLRIDRYYVGEPSAPNTVFMPLLCQHCDNAPCETVCPVLATVHSSEGTNDMIYNRCVGTRYCSNNCPYKVRRFNWFNFSKGFTSPLNMALNPEVTVRARGVMEKCTFCTHKIQAAKSKARLEDRKLKDGDVVTACEASCPTGAIVFGDVNDPESRVSQSMKDARAYSLLEELNVRPAVQYKSKIRNTEHLVTEGAGHGGHA